MRTSTIPMLGMLALAGVMWMPGAARAQGSDARIEQLMADHSVPGLALAVVTAESTFLAGFGTTRPEGGEAVTADTPFRLASVAKVLVAATVLTEVQAGRLDLRTDITGLVDVPLVGRYAGPVTLHDLMTHTAGFDERLVGYAARSAADMRPLGEYLSDRMPARGWPAGSIVSYSNHGMSLAAFVAERAAERSFAELASSDLFGPLGMNSTTFFSRGSQLPAGLAEPMSCSDGECNLVPHVYSHAYPAGLAFSTSRDMSRFLAAVLSGEDYPAGLADLLPARFTHDRRIPGMSYGFFNQVHGGRRVLSHSGSVPGYSSLLFIVPDEELGFFFVANGGDSGFGNDLRDLVLASMLGEDQISEPVHRRTEDPTLRAGTYELTRYSHDTIERFPQVFNNAINVSARGDTLVLFDERYIQVDDSLYQLVGGEKLLAFGTREGKPYLFRGSEVYGARLPAAYERRRTSTYFLNEYVSWLLAVPVLVMLLGWSILVGLGALLRRRRGESRPGFHAVSLAATLGAVLASGLFAWFGMGFGARSNRLFQTGEMFFGMPDYLVAMTWIPPAHAVLAALATLALAAAWRRSWWDLPRRVLYTTLVIALLLQVSFHVSWNYLPVSW